MSWCYNDQTAPNHQTKAIQSWATVPRRKERKLPVIYQAHSDDYVTTMKNIVKKKLSKMLRFDRASQLHANKSKWEWDRKWMDDLINEPREWPPRTDDGTIRPGMHKPEKCSRKIHEKKKTPNLSGLERTSEHQHQSNAEISTKEWDNLKIEPREYQPRFDYCTKQQGTQPTSKVPIKLYKKPKALHLSGREQISELQPNRHSTRIYKSNYGYATPDYSPNGPPARPPLYFPHSSPKSPPAPPPSMTRTALESTYDKARGRGETASLSVKTRGGRETLVFCSNYSTPKSSGGSYRSDRHSSVQEANRRQGEKSNKPGLVEESTEPGIEMMNRGIEDTGEDLADYYCIGTAAGDSGRGGPQDRGREGSTKYDNVVLCSKDLAVKGSYKPNRENKFRGRVRQGEAKRVMARGQEYVLV